MKLWSRGLGSTEISMDFRTYKVTKDKKTGDVIIIGNMQDPVNWEFKITMEPDDIPGFMKIMFNLSILILGLKNCYKYIIYLFNRKKYNNTSTQDLETKVEAAYQQIMHRTRPRPRLSRN